MAINRGTLETAISRFDEARRHLDKAKQELEIGMRHDNFYNDYKNRSEYEKKSAEETNALITGALPDDLIETLDGLSTIVSTARQYLKVQEQFHLLCSEMYLGNRSKAEQAQLEIAAEIIQKVIEPPKED